jgi:protocatechuate 3,4-dioxygenase beta subunit
MRGLSLVRLRSRSKKVGVALAATAALTVGLGALPASAAPTIGLAFTQFADGTPSWSSAPGAGEDTDASNGITRTQDVYVMKWGINVNGQSADSAVLTQTLPVGMVWDLSSAPPACISTTYSTDKRTITCDMGSLSAPTAFDVTATARVSGNNLNGAVLTIPSPTFTATNASGTSTAPPRPALSTIVSATPKLDLRKDRDQWTQIAAKGADGITPGIVMFHPISIEVVGGGKGSEALLPNQPIQIIDTPVEYLSGTGLSATGGGTVNSNQNGTLYTWGTGTWGTGVQDGCYYNGEAATPQGVHFYSTMPYGQPNLYEQWGTAHSSEPSRNLPNPGVWSCTQSAPGAPITLTITGADTSGDNRPIYAGYPSYDYALPADTTFITAGMIGVWYPVSDFPTTGPNAYQLDARNRVVFDPASPPMSISNRPNVEPHNPAPALGQDAGPAAADPWFGTNDNARIFTMVGYAGNFDKYYTAPETNSTPFYYIPPSASAARSGDAFVGPGQNYSSHVFRSNGGFLIQDNLLCDVFDNTWQEIKPLTTTRGSQKPGSQGALLEGAYWSANPIPVGRAFTIEYSAKTEADVSSLRSATCEDTDGPWYPDLASVPGGAPAVTRVRSAVSIEGGESFALIVNLQAKATAPDNALLVNFGKFKDQYSTSTYPTTGGWYVPDYTPANDGSGNTITGKPWNALGYISTAYLPLASGGGGDRIRIGRAQARVTKKTVNGTAADDTVDAVRAGNKVTYEIAPTFTSYLPTPPVADHYYVYDVLDHNASYITGSSVANPATPAVPQPTITPSTDPGTGKAIVILKWDLGVRNANDPLPTIRYQVRTKSNAPGGTNVANSVMVDAVDATGAALDSVGCLNTAPFTIGGSHDIGWAIPSQNQTAKAADTSCPRGWSRNVTVNQVASLTVGKEVLEKSIERDGTYTFRVTYANVLNTPTLTDIDIVDALPEAADGRDPASHFFGTESIVAGSLQIVDSFGIGTTTLYVTNATRAAVRSIYETDPANPLPITTVPWCLASAIGSGGAGCPATWAGVTGWRMNDTGPLDKGDYATIEFKMTTLGNAGGDLYTNRASGKAAEVTLPVSSNDVSMPVVAGTISNFVWIDANGNGLQDAGEAVLPSTQVALFQADGTTQVQTYSAAGGDGVRGTGDDVYVPYVVSTDSNGLYSFTNLKAGDYKVIFTPPAGYRGTTPLVGADRASDSNPSRVGATNNYITPLIHLGCRDASGTDLFAGTPSCDPVYLDSVDDDPTIDAGFYKLASIGDLVWQDTNGDGKQGAVGVEPPVAGAQVTLWKDADGDPATVDWVQVTADANGATFGTAGTITTAANGLYLFDNIAPAVYQVRFVAPAGMSLTTPTVGTNAATDSNAVPTTGAPSTGATAPIVLSSGEANRDVDAGVYTPATIGDKVWNDTNADGKQDAGEPGIAGAGVTLWRDADGDPATVDWVQVTADINGAPFGTAGTITTGTTGAYLFDNLAPGNYRVEFTAPAGKIFTTALASGVPAADNSDATPVTATLARSGTYTLNSGDVNLTVDAGVTQTTGLGDRVWLDADGDGQQGTDLVAEPGIDDVTVTIEKYDTVSGTWSSTFNGPGGSAYGSTTTTASGGLYSFVGLVPGQYRVVVSPPSGFAVTPNDLGSNVTDSDINTVTGVSEPRTLAPGDFYQDLDAGLFERLKVGNLVWEDLNADGIQDAGELGIPGVKVEILDALGNVVATTTTSGTGGWQIDRLGADQTLATAAALPPGTYTARFTRPTGYAPSPAAGAPDAAAADSDALFTSNTAATGTTSAFTLTSGESEQRIDAGFWKPASIGDYVWDDANGDGQQGLAAAEPPLAGAKVTLWKDADGDPATIDWVQVTADINGSTFGTAGTLTTGADGKYLFDNLAPATYQVRFTPPTGYNFTAANKGAAATDSNADPATGFAAPVTLKSGDAVTTVDAGMYRPASLGNFVFEDTNRNGVQDAGEFGVANVPVTLTGTDGAGNPVSLTTTTIADGSYAFTGLAPGTYTVSVLPVSAFTPTVPGQGTTATDSNIALTDLDPGAGQKFSMAPVTLASGENNTTLDAGLVKAPTISGHVYVDANNDGVRDSGEQGIAGTIVTLTGKDFLGNAVTLTATTDANGYYEFPNLLPSDAAGYALTETQPAGYLDGKDKAGSTGGAMTNDKISTIVLLSSAVSVNNDFGELIPAALSGIVYVDNTDDGLVQSGEPRIGGVLITLSGTDDLGNPVSATTNTAADGTYSFPNLRPGTYTVTEGPTAGYNDGKDTAGSTGGVTTTNDTISAIPLASGQTSTANNFGERPTTPPAGTTFVEGTVWLDPNRDGVRQAGENTGIAGVTIKLLDAAGNIVATTTTDANGHYRFDGIVPGNYRIAETQPADYLSTSSNNLGTAGTPLVVPAAGLTGQDFFEALGSIAGHVYVDTVDNGTRDATEPGIGGTVVKLYNATTGALVATTTTSADGSYRFDNLLPGNYKVVETQPAGYVDDLDAAGSLGGTMTNDQITSIPLVAGDQGVNYDFGEQPVPTTPGKTWVSGHVYVDSNTNNVLNPGEQGLAGVLITLKDSGGNTVATTTTAADGSYLFNNIDPGTYTIAETQPAGYTSTEHPTDSISSVSVPAAGLPNQNFGETLPAGTTANTFLSGTVWVDRDGDGVIDAGEPGIQGVIITLKDALGNVVATTTTAADGSYSFTNLAPGTYSVEETQPTGYANSAGTPATTRSTIVVPLAGIANQNFGEQLAQLSGNVYQDVNGDGSKGATEPGIGGVTVKLTGTDVNGNPVMLTTVTDASGHYEFKDLLPPNGAGYTITETQPSAFVDGLDLAGSLGGTSTNDVTSAITFAPGANGIDYNFGEVANTPPTPPGTVWIGGIVYRDLDRDGTMDPGDTAMVGVKVYLKDSSGNIVGTTVTAADGSYVFTGLTPGASYTVVEDQPVGYGSSQAPTNSIPVTAPATGGATGFNFGETLSTISGSVYVDANDDGVKQAGETPIGGVTVTLTGTAADGSIVLLTTTTGPDGSYSFADLKAGNYTVVESQPVGYNDGKDTAGSLPATTTNDRHTAIELPTGTDAPGYNFGERQTASITTYLEGKVFLDRGSNGMTSNGTLEAGEPGVGGVLITLKDANGNVVATTTTLPDGTYHFDGIAPGNYTVVESQPNGYGSTTPNTLSVSVPLTGSSNNNFGETLGATFGTVFSDANGNGTKDPLESGIGGVTITLTGTDINGNPVTRTTTTNPDGSWVITDLLPSGPAGYTVTETQPTGWLDGSDASSKNGVITNDRVSGVMIGVGQVKESGNFGEIAPAKLGNFVWNDANANGLQDVGEAAIGGVVVTLTGTDDLGNAVSATMTTAADGSYEFGGLRPGTYTVTFTPPAGMVATYGSIGSDRATDSDVADSCGCVTVTMMGNKSLADTSANRPDLDAGFVAPVSVVGSVYNNNDRTVGFTSGDTPLGGRTVTIQGLGPDGVAGTPDDPAPVSVLSNADGTYSAAGLIPGSYTITVADLPSATIAIPAGTQGLQDFPYPKKKLPVTGADLFRLLFVAFGLFAAGVLLVGAQRRRRSA